MATRGRPRKVQEVEGEEKKEEEVVASIPTITVTSLPVTSGVKPLPTFGGVKVVEILSDGRETATQYHCKLADGTTAHVDKSLF